MDFSNLPPHNYLLYIKPWNKIVDKVFVKHLIKQKQMGVLLAEALLTVKDMLNNELNLDLIWEDLYYRFHFLEKWYDTYKWLIAFDGTQWDRERNRVFMSDEKWVQIFRMKPTAQAYYSRDEPLYNDLMVFFGLEDVKEEEKSILAVNLPDIGDSDNKSVEVTSSPFNAACRRLFDGPSTSAARSGTIDPRTIDRKTSPKQSRCSSTSTLTLMWWKP